jgi:hypothetical protein
MVILRHKIGGLRLLVENLLPLFNAGDALVEKAGLLALSSPAISRAARRPAACQKPAKLHV